MNPYQETALANPIPFAFEACQDKFRHVEAGHSVIVTINYGYE